MPGQHLLLHERVSAEAETCYYDVRSHGDGIPEGVAAGAACDISDHGGRTAAPATAIAMTDPPSFVSGARPRTPRAKIVGNIKDIKKRVATRAYAPSNPGRMTAKPTSRMLIKA